MDMNFTEEQNMLRESVRKLMDRHAPVEKIRQWDKERVYPYELYDEWVKAGLLGMPFPEEYGGLGGNIIDLAIISEELSRRSTDLSIEGDVTTRTVSLSTRTMFTKRRRPGLSFFTDGEQQQLSPGDRFCENAVRYRGRK